MLLNFDSPFHHQPFFGGSLRSSWSHTPLYPFGLVRSHRALDSDSPLSLSIPSIPFLAAPHSHTHHEQEDVNDDREVQELVIRTPHSIQRHYIVKNGSAAAAAARRKRQRELQELQLQQERLRRLRASAAARNHLTQLHAIQQLLQGGEEHQKMDEEADTQHACDECVCLNCDGDCQHECECDDVHENDEDNNVEQKVKSQPPQVDQPQPQAVTAGAGTTTATPNKSNVSCQGSKGVRYIPIQFISSQSTTETKNENNETNKDMDDGIEYLYTKKPKRRQENEDIHNVKINMQIDNTPQQRQQESSAATSQTNQQPANPTVLADAPMGTEAETDANTSAAAPASGASPLVSTSGSASPTRSPRESVTIKDITDSENEEDLDDYLLVNRS